LSEYFPIAPSSFFLTLEYSSPSPLLPSSLLSDSDSSEPLLDDDGGGDEEDGERFVLEGGDSCDWAGGDFWEEEPRLVMLSALARARDSPICMASEAVIDALGGGDGISSFTSFRQ